MKRIALSMCLCLYRKGANSFGLGVYTRESLQWWFHGASVWGGSWAGRDGRYDHTVRQFDEYNWVHRNKVILPTPHVHFFLSYKIICHEVICTPFAAHCTLYKTLISIKPMKARSNFDLISKIGDTTTTHLYIAGDVNGSKQIEPEVDFVLYQY